MIRVSEKRTPPSGINYPAKGSVVSWRLATQQRVGQRFGNRRPPWIGGVADFKKEGTPPDWGGRRFQKEGTPPGLERSSSFLWL